MPFGNGTGPAGMGPMTGRAAGYCAGYNMPGYANPFSGRGFGGRGGRGGGWGRRGAWYGTPYYGVPAYGVPAYGVPAYGTAPYSPGQELDALKAQAQYLQETLEGINKKVAELEKESKS